MTRASRLIVTVAASAAIAGVISLLTPGRAAATPPCPNITCYFAPPEVLYCGYYANWGCSMASPDECKTQSCNPT